ncbi:MAG: GNAT family N-acetyltransferase [Kordiimonadaceae bacterium]|nr:GNAT family N-acetyltransferase [Kordiimonadaceae bacterium]
MIKASFSSLLTSKYEDISLSAVLPQITRINPVLLTCGTYYILHNGEKKIMGCGGWTHERPGSSDSIKGEAHLRHFATHPNFIGRGVGRAIFNHCKIMAKQENVRRFMCYATLNAEIFYKSLGFKTEKPINIDLGEGLSLPSLLMTAEI